MYRARLVFLGSLVFCIVEINGYHAKRSGDRSHICCEVEVKDTYLNVTQEQYITENKTIERTVLTDKLRPCHEGEQPFTYDLFTAMCQVSETVRVTVEELVPKNVTVLVPQKGSCPPEHSICCDGYKKMGNQCIEIKTANSPELQALIDAGLVVG